MLTKSRFCGLYNSTHMYMRMVFHRHVSMYGNVHTCTRVWYMYTCMVLNIHVHVYGIHMLNTIHTCTTLWYSTHMHMYMAY